ncbi:hypothetical protein ACFFWC_15230 [Plantactinospora siamensis]|uniref:Methyltransferase domain-containing protein n=1 Tax=Plantactinospora siamensis TaxID=555372 RepID=A0ABV6P0W2_9ACTN
MNASAIKRSLRKVPLLGPAARQASISLQRRRFPGSAQYWQRHYAAGGTSGNGSAGRLAEFKAEILNDLVQRNRIRSVVEFGCGDGQQLALASYPRYLGLDVAPAILDGTMARFSADPTKSFLRYDPHRFVDPAGFVTAELALSLDVIYHLVEDDTYALHLRHVFGAASRMVVLFTSDADTLTLRERTAPHVRHRSVVADIRARLPHWTLVDRIPNRFPYQGSGTETSFADFFVYQRVD